MNALLASIAILLAVNEPVYYAATPEGAALNVVYNSTGAPIRVRRINIAGRYATVLLQGAFMEGTPENAPILVEQFSFGWQALDSLNFSCRLYDRYLGDRTEAVLMQGMPKPQPDFPCGRVAKDSGPQAEVEALRRQGGPLVPQVVVRGAYAVLHWYGAGGGMAVYHLNGGRWHVILRGGGTHSSAEMLAAGVPHAYLCAFGVFDAKCP